MMGSKVHFVKLPNVQIIVVIKDFAIEENVIVSMDFMERIALKY